MSVAAGRCIGFVFALAVVAIAVPVRAAGPMTLSDAVDYGLDHNPGIAQKYAAVAQLENSVAKSTENALPTVTGSLQNSLGKSSNYGGGFAAIGVSQQNVFSQNTAQLGTNYTIATGGLSFIQLAAVKAQLAQAQKDLAASEDQLATTITNAFFSVVQKQAIETVDESDLHYQDVLVSVARAKERAGFAAGVDVLQAQVAQAKSNATLAGGKADVDDARETLAQTIGAPLDTEFAFPATIASPPLPTQSVATLSQIAQNSRPDVRSAHDALDAARLTRKGWSRELAPQIQMGAAFGSQINTTVVPETTNPGCFTPIFNPACTLPPIQLPRNGSGFWTLSATSTFALPLVDYGQRHTERLSDDAQVGLAQENYEHSRTQADLDVRQSYRGARTAQTQLSFARNEARYGNESARIAQLQYQHGLKTLFDVIAAQQQSVVAQSDLINAQVAYVEAIVRLRVSLGTYDPHAAVADLR